MPISETKDIDYSSVTDVRCEDDLAVHEMNRIGQRFGSNVLAADCRILANERQMTVASRPEADDTMVTKVIHTRGFYSAWPVQ